MLNRNLRLINVVLGLWVVISALVWPRAGGNFYNSWITGVVIIVSSLLAIRTQALRMVTAAAGIWLVASMFAWPDYSSPMVWNNAMVGAAVAMTSLVGPEHAEMFAD
jgi:hypothetical protein